MAKSIFIQVAQLRIRVTDIMWYEPISGASVSIMTSHKDAILDFVDEEERDAALVLLDEVCLI